MAATPMHVGRERAYVGGMSVTANFKQPKFSIKSHLLNYNISKKILKS